MELSDNHKQAVEITVTRSCSVRCQYCPQDQLVKAGSIVGSSQLTPEVFKECIENLIGSAKSIHWTGYAEPCMARFFPEMVQHAQNKGFSQMVSTTLVGHQHCIDFLAATNAFDTIVLHLPDGKGLMEDGALKVDEKYVDRLRKFLEGRLDIPNCKSCTILAFTFGKNFHPQIAPILADPRYKSVLQGTSISSKIHSRAGAIRHFRGLAIGMIAKSLSLSGLKFKSRLIQILKAMPLPFYKCSYRRLRQPVLLPDGQLNLCCMDYGLRGILGNLSTSSLKSIYADWDSRNMDNFAKGKLSPCNQCEYYQHISLYDLIQRLRHRN